ncbi:MAG: M48 family metalloprotease [Verrucomicrobia bacterium]|nr:M48 family metalloprotease [Verrucomicrobiota bacterium]
MFTNVLFLCLVLLSVNLAPQASQTISLAPGFALALGGALYILFLLLIVAQNLLLRKIVSSERLAIFANLELILFFLLYHGVLAAQTSYEAPFVGYSSQGLVSLISLILYFAALFLFHFTTHQDPHVRKAPHYSDEGYAWLHIRFLAPFAGPFLLFAFAFDLFHWTSPLAFGPGSQVYAAVTAVILSLVGLSLIILLFPWFLNKAWGCFPLRKGPLFERLERLCDRTAFTHAGLMTWPILRHSLNAAILGVTGRFRYVMFTPRLIENLTEQEVEAVLAHEIGHSRHHHLLLYPCILMGMVIAVGLYALYFAPPLEEYLSLRVMLHEDSIWSLMAPIFTYLPYALIVFLYFRYVFGPFSRRFERQADLFIFEANVPPDALIRALDKIGIFTGYTHHKPSWHHYGINERIDCLQRARLSPTLIASYHKNLKNLFFSYIAIALAALMWLIAPFMEGMPGVQPLVQSMGMGTLDLTEKITAATTKQLREELAKKWYDELHLIGDENKILPALEEAFLPFGASTIAGAAEFYAAQYLYKAEQYEASAQMMTLAWQTLNYNSASPGTQKNFDIVTKALLKKMQGHLAKQLQEAEAKGKNAPKSQAPQTEAILELLI